MNRFEQVSVPKSDPLTGRTVRRLTTQPGNHHHLYFTSTSFDADDEHLIYISESAAQSPNLFRVSLVSGETVQLTNNEDGFLKSYVYYDGNPYAGLGKASVSYNPETETLLYLQGNDVRVIDLKTKEDTVVFTLPEEVMTGFTHVSPDGRFACVPVIAADAFAVSADAWMRNILHRVVQKQIESHMYVIDLQTGRGEVAFTHPGWVTHVQFHPHQSNKVLFNHEGGAVDQRIWLYDDGKVSPIRDQSGDSSLWICHELWVRDGDGILYHGTRTTENSAYSFVGLHVPSTGEETELCFPEGLTAYGHFMSDRLGTRVVTDGVIRRDALHLCQTDWNRRTLTWDLLCLHGSSFSTQDVHPHPVFSHNERSVVFSSDAENERGMGHVYLVDL